MKHVVLLAPLVAAVLASASGVGEIAIFGGGRDVSYLDALYAVRPWQPRGTFALVPTFYVGPSWMRISQSKSCWITCEGTDARWSALGGTIGVTLDVKLGP